MNKNESVIKFTCVPLLHDDHNDDDGEDDHGGGDSDEDAPGQVVVLALWFEVVGVIAVLKLALSVASVFSQLPTSQLLTSLSCIHCQWTKRKA